MSSVGINAWSADAWWMMSRDQRQTQVEMSALSATVGAFMEYFGLICWHCLLPSARAWNECTRTAPSTFSFLALQIYKKTPFPSPGNRSAHAARKTWRQMKNVSVPPVSTVTP